MAKILEEIVKIIFKIKKKIGLNLQFLFLWLHAT